MIDVSEYQGVIDWEKVYEDGVRRAYIKASEGATEVDSRYRDNVRKAKQAGIQVGLYHYGHPTNSPVREWRHFQGTIAGMIHPGDLPPMLDLEVTEGHTWKYLNDWKAQWLHLADAAIDVEHGAGLYSYYYFLKNMETYSDRPLWGAATGLKFVVPENWSIHQYSFKGSVKGILGYVDLDKVLKDLPMVAVGV